MNKSDDFIEDRIRWRAKQGNLPSSSTFYWEDSPVEYKNIRFQNLGIPVVISINDVNNLLIVCTKGIFIKSDGRTSYVQYTDISDIESPPLKKNEKKSELSYLKLVLKNNDVCALKAEEGAAFFSIWNILLMLIRMN